MTRARRESARQRGVVPSNVHAVARTPTDTHEWLSFEDEDEERTWVFDVTFLTSNWTCIFGNGCQGVLTGPAPELVQGCCSYGAHLVDKKDARRVQKAAASLTPEEWQNHGTKKNVIHTNKHGETVTRIVDDACIFLNRPGLRRRGRLRLPRRRAPARRELHDAQARSLLAAPAAPRGPRRRRRRARDLGGPPVGPAPLGQGWTRIPLVVHRGARGVRRQEARLSGDAVRADRDGRGQGLRPLRGAGARA